MTTRCMAATKWILRMSDLRGNAPQQAVGRLLTQGSHRSVRPDHPVRRSVCDELARKVRTTAAENCQPLRFVGKLRVVRCAAVYGGVSQRPAAPPNSLRRGVLQNALMEVDKLFPGFHAAGFCLLNQ